MSRVGSNQSIMSPEKAPSQETLIREKIHTLINEEGTNFGSEGGVLVIDKLKKEVEGADGQLFIMVHPFFEDYNTKGDPYGPLIEEHPWVKEIQTRFNESVEGFMQKPDIPVLVLEDRNNTDACFNRFLRQGLVPEKDIYLAPTFSDFGTPYIVDSSEREEGEMQIHPAVVENYLKWTETVDVDKRSPLMGEISNKYIFEIWSLVSAVLKENVGVKRIVLGGKYFSVETNENGLDVPSRCLGEVYNFLDYMASEMGIEVELSELSFPINAINVDKTKMRTLRDMDSDSAGGK